MKRDILYVLKEWEEPVCFDEKREKRRTTT